MVKDELYFGEEGQEPVEFTFGCASLETNLFYTQKVDGILGMGMRKRIGEWEQMPIYEAMAE